MKVIKLVALLIFGSVLMSSKCSGITKTAKKISPPPSIVKKADDVDIKKVPQEAKTSQIPPNHILRARRLLKDSTNKSY